MPLNTSSIEEVQSIRQKIAEKEKEQELIANEIKALNADLDRAFAALASAPAAEPNAIAPRAPAGDQNVPGPQAMQGSGDIPSPAKGGGKASGYAPAGDPNADVAMPTAPKPGSLGRALSVFKEDEEYEPKDRNAQVAQHLMAQKMDEADRTVKVNWGIYRERKHMMFKKDKDGNEDRSSKPMYGSYDPPQWDQSRLSDFTLAEFQQTLQEALVKFCNQQTAPTGYSKYQAPKVVSMPTGGYKPRPVSRSGNQGQALVIFDQTCDMERLLAVYDAQAKPFIEVNVANPDEKAWFERIYLTRWKVHHDDHTDTASMAETQNSNMTVTSQAAGAKGKKDLLLASGINHGHWTNAVSRWYVHDAVVASAAQICKQFGLDLPTDVSFDHPKPAPEGAICLHFASYEMAKAFMDKVNDYPTGLRAGGDKLLLHWAKQHHFHSAVERNPEEANLEKEEMKHRKKLREIEALQKRKDAGETLDKMQEGKIESKSDTEKELETTLEKYEGLEKEKRISEDGKAYTYRAFIEFYKGEGNSKWTKAKAKAKAKRY